MMEWPKPADIKAMLVEVLVGTSGGTEGHWRAAIGEVEALPIWEHPNCNWRVTPASTMEDDLFAITRAAELLRFEHPYVHG